MPSAQTLIRVNESSQVGEARRNAVKIAELTTLSETDRGKVAIVATEMANNLVRHAPGGEMLISRFHAPGSGRQGVEILAIDRGPGMANVSRCLEDGYSTAGTAGTGFGAIRRLSTEFDVFSACPGGTVVLSRVLTDANDHHDLFQWGVVCQPCANETLCGDNWSITENDGVLSIAVIDGLGHGPLAAKAADEGIRVFDENPLRMPGTILDAAHGRLRSTRGAAMAIAHIQGPQQTIKYVGVGNIAGSALANGESRGLFSHNGTVGLQVHKIQEFDYPWTDRSLLVMHSDGIKTRWDLSTYPGLIHRHPSVIAGILYRDFTRGRDDVTVAVLRQR